jgi:glutamate formiminotransferase/formiminotetrahydrofolate cyclodeaminase
MQQIVECVPNFSEGRDKSVIQAITREIEETDGAVLLDVDPGFATNRTVVTFIGTPAAAKEAAFRAIRRAAELIDMRKHHGEHARMGATDVCPFVPVSGVTMEDCVQIAKELGQRVGGELGIPVYLYEEAASRPERNNLATVREGEYEGLAEKLKDPDWQPDHGPHEFNEKAGTTIIGAREFLIAYNVNLNTRDRRLANEIALNLREKGRLKRNGQEKIVRDENGIGLRVPGRLKAVKGVGWYIEEYGQAQVSYNLVNYKITPLHVLFEESCKEAEKLGVRVTGSELVGLIPLQAMLEAGRHALSKQGKSTGVTDDELIHMAVKFLCLDDLGEFVPNKKIIEFCFGSRYGRLANMRLHEFADELSSNSPAPGGGSVAALAGSLAAALGSMVASLTHGNKEYTSAWKEMEQLGVECQELKGELNKAIDRDTEAFNQVMNASRMPKKSPQDQTARDKAIQEATKHATQVPLNVMERSLEVMKWCKSAAEKGNQNAVSDAGVGALIGCAAVHGAYLNVKINIPGIEDDKFRDKMQQAGKKIISEAYELKDEILKIVDKKLGS